MLNPFSFQLADLFHVFPPEQVFDPPLVPRVRVTPLARGGGEFSNGTMGIFAPALTRGPPTAPGWQVQRQRLAKAKCKCPYMNLKLIQADTVPDRAHGAE